MAADHRHPPGDGDPEFPGAPKGGRPEDEKGPGGKGKAENMTAEEIFYEDGGAVANTEELRALMARVLAEVLPDEIIEKVFAEVYFVCERPHNGRYLNAESLKGRSLIILHDSIFEDEGEARSLILHEIAHHVLGHRLDANADLQAYKEQEKAASALAGEWLERLEDEG